MDSDDELAEIRRRKMQEMQRSAMDDQASAEEQRRAQELEKARKQQILRQILTPDARERLSRVRLVKPELAENVENQLIQLAGMGRVNRMISDQDVREILDTCLLTIETAVSALLILEDAFASLRGMFINNSAVTSSSAIHIHLTVSASSFSSSFSSCSG